MKPYFEMRDRDRSFYEEYLRARLVLFRDAIDSACGYAESATGPLARRIYLLHHSRI